MSEIATAVMAVGKWAYLSVDNYIDKVSSYSIIEIGMRTKNFTN